ncbi:MAG: hypothetical protein JKY92_04820 [Magnetovibrio sp.]|nr:hypothetical protein [Magnetovibrio sp.]
MALAGSFSSLWDVSILLQHEKRLAQLQTENFPVLIAAYEVARHGESIAKGASGVVLTNDKWARIAFVNRIDDQFEWLERQLKVLADKGFDSTKLKRIEKNKVALRKSYQDLTAAVDALAQRDGHPFMIGSSQDNVLVQNVERLLNVHKRDAERMTDSMAELAAFISNEIKVLLTDTMIQIRKQIWIMAVYSLVAVLFAILVGLYLDQNVSRRVVAIQRAMRKVVEGEKSGEIPCSGHNEITDMGEALGLFVEQLGEREENLQELVSERTQELAFVNQNLRTSERRLLNLFEVASDWFWELNKEFHIVKMSPHFLEVARSLSYINFIEDLSIFHFLHLPEVSVEEDAYKRFKECLVSRTAYRQFEFSVKVTDSETIFLQASGLPFFDEHGQFMGYQGAITDITEYKQAELEKRHTQKMLALGNLAGGVAHSFNNIFQPILLLSEVTLNEMPENSPIHGRMQLFLDVSRRGRALCNQILLYSRQDEPNMESFDICRLLHTSLALFESSVPSTIRLDVNLDQQTGQIIGDASQIEAMLLNITSNAVDAIGEKSGQITVCLSQVDRQDVDCDSSSDLVHDHYAKISVSDNGSGIDSKIMSQIFDPFFTTKGLGRGTGLGLSMVNGISMRHGGVLKVTSTLNEGSVFNVFLPISSTSFVHDLKHKER